MKLHNEAHKRMTALEAEFDASLRDRGVDPDAPCVLVMHNGAAHVLLIDEGRWNLGLEDLYSAPESVGAERIETVGHVVLGETWDGAVIDAWFEDDGLSLDSCQPTCITSEDGHTLCGPVIVTSSAPDGNTKALSVSDAYSCLAGRNLFQLIPSGLSWKKPEPGFKVVDLDTGREISPN